MKQNSGSSRITWGVVLIVAAALWLLRGVVYVAVATAAQDPYVSAAVFGLVLPLALLAGGIRLLLGGLNRRRLFLAHREAA